MKIMFMGTPDISAMCLESLLSSSHDVVAVVSGEDKPRGRGNIITPTPTKKLALDNGIPVYTPKSLRTEEFAKILSEVAPEMIVVVAYGKILPKNVIDFPKHGCLNVHVSLLPKYRGAAPMQRAIMEGEKETGVTIMYMDEGLDTGDIILQKAFEILPTDDFEAIHDRSASEGSKLLIEAIDNIEAGRLRRTAQDNALATYAKKIEKEECKLNLTLSAKELDCIIRGLTPIPGAYVMHNGKMLKIFRATPIECKRGTLGEVVDINAKGEGSFTVKCGEGALLVAGVIPEGKGRMSAGDFVRGRKISLSDILE